MMITAQDLRKLSAEDPRWKDEMFYCVICEEFCFGSRIADINFDGWFCQYHPRKKAELIAIKAQLHIDYVECDDPEERNRIIDIKLNNVRVEFEQHKPTYDEWNRWSIA